MITGSNNEKALEVRTHDIPVADAMGEFMKQGWAQSPLEGISAHPSVDRKSTRLNSSHSQQSRMPSSA